MMNILYRLRKKMSRSNEYENILGRGKTLIPIKN